MKSVGDSPFKSNAKLTWFVAPAVESKVCGHVASPMEKMVAVPAEKVANAGVKEAAALVRTMEDENFMVGRKTKY